MKGSVSDFLERSDTLIEGVQATKTQMWVLIWRWGSEDFHRKRGKIAENRALIDAISGLIADFQRLIDVNAGGLGLKKGPGNLTPNLNQTKKLPSKDFLERSFPP